MWGWWVLCKPGQLLRLLVYGSGWFLDQALTALEDRWRRAPLTQLKRKFRVLQILSFRMDLFGSRAVECCAVFGLLSPHAIRIAITPRSSREMNRMDVPHIYARLRALQIGFVAQSQSAELVASRHE